MKIDEEATITKKNIINKFTFGNVYYIIINGTIKCNYKQRKQITKGIN